MMRLEEQIEHMMTSFSTYEEILSSLIDLEFVPGINRWRPSVHDKHNLRT